MKLKSNKGRRSRAVKTPVLNVDRLSNLPNDVLLNILERLSTLDAIRTCVLSKQMLHLPAMLLQIAIVLGSRDLVHMNGVVADVTGKILRTRCPWITIRKLEVRFVLKRHDCLSIGTSVARAMTTQRLDAAEFEILTEKASDRCTDADLVDSAKQFNTFLCDYPDAFAGLTRLHLQDLRFSGELDIPNILTTCKRLESLRLFQCDAGIRSSLHLEHAGLVELDIAFGRFETVELQCLPKLQWMTYDNWAYNENPLVLGSVPQLSKLSLVNTGLSDRIIKLSQLLANVHSVCDLHLDFEREKIWVRPECPKVLAPVLDKLRHVNLDNLPEECEAMFFLEAAPSLEELCITVWDHKCRKEKQRGVSVRTDVKWEPSTADHFKHENLAKLTIHGFQANNSFTGSDHGNCSEHKGGISARQEGLQALQGRSCGRGSSFELSTNRLGEGFIDDEDDRGIIGDGISCCDSLQARLL